MKAEGKKTAKQKTGHRCKYLNRSSCRFFLWSGNSLAGDTVHSACRLLGDVSYPSIVSQRTEMLEF